MPLVEGKQKEARSRPSSSTSKARAPAAAPAIDLSKLSPGFVPSSYQLAIFDFVLNGAGDGLVNAVVGSGKTTTLREAARLLATEALFVAFNKHIADELNRRLSGTPMVAKTIHSVGNACLMKRLGKPKIEDRKYSKLCREVVQRGLSRSRAKISARPLMR